MDQELKQRLIGAAVVTALAAIFIPMLFDDPVDTSGQAVSEMTIPEPPTNAPNGPESKLPANAADVDNAAGPGNPSTDNPTPNASPVNAADIERVEPGLQEPPVDYEPPAEVDPTLEKHLDQAAEGQPVTDLEDQKSLEKAGAIDSAGAQDEPVEDAPVLEAPPPAAVTEIKSAPPVAATKKTSVKTTPAPIKPQVDSSKAKPAPTKPAVTSKTPAAKTAAGFERWYVQAGSYAKKENAVSQWEALRKQGLPATLETQATDKGTIYRLRVGPELSKQRAVDIKSRLSQQNIKSIIITE
ncbi:SPOR domain-containing protein [Methylomicrobium sp. Wu6]|uniref:SPOR domain-containing protein n=1 Tax=Methylomicrobium sp. Wu6 TaxID=3107928 RepID=UPI002DD679E9|nr:SPOR domain-containing protein [Methylomicrobium sp. Wu6]MEC4748319.1 SPOR domain-containing protein [Methylomicrobium sp. Wu6]